MKVIIYIYGNILGITTLTPEQIKTLENEEGFTIELVKETKATA